jgi:hypothetical protein
MKPRVMFRVRSIPSSFRVLEWSLPAAGGSVTT